MAWNQSEAIALCRLLEEVTPEHGAHVALTGGCLYKDGKRKDTDVLFYRIRQWPQIKMDDMWDALAKRGFVKKSGFGWCYKAEFFGKPVDCFFPEAPRDEDGNEIEYNAEVAASNQAKHEKDAAIKDEDFDDGLPF